MYLLYVWILLRRTNLRTSTTPPLGGSGRKFGKRFFRISPLHFNTRQPATRYVQFFGNRFVHKLTNKNIFWIDISHILNWKPYNYKIQNFKLVRMIFWTDIARRQNLEILRWFHKYFALVLLIIRTDLMYILNWF